MAESTFRAGPWVLEAFVDIVFTDVTLEAGWAVTLNLGVCGQAYATIGAGVGWAEVPDLALPTCPPRHAGALWVAGCLEVTTAPFGAEERGTVVF